LAGTDKKRKYLAPGKKKKRGPEVQDQRTRNPYKMGRFLKVRWNQGPEGTEDDRTYLGERKGPGRKKKKKPKKKKKNENPGANRGRLTVHNIKKTGRHRQGHTRTLSEKKRKGKKKESGGRMNECKIAGRESSADENVQ